MLVRILLPAAIGLLLVAQIIRNAVVQDAEQQLTRASALWPRHPEVLAVNGMSAVGTAAAAGEVPSEATLDMFRRLAIAAPHAPEPYLVNAAMAVKQGDDASAERLLQHALERDPRSRAGRYLLADLYMREGQVAKGLTELALLTRLAPRSSVPFAAAIGQFARSGGTAAQLRQIFSLNPRLEEPVLKLLAQDPDNARLIVEVASPAGVEGSEGHPAWQPILLNSMVEAGRYREAHALWLRLTDNSPGSGGGVFNPRYADTSEPPPFNWKLTSNATGVAENEDGMLHVFHYGSSHSVLAEQLLLLEPGTYRVGMRVTGEGNQPGQLAWSLTCLPSREQVMRAFLPPDDGLLRSRFDVPGSGCSAQLLALKGLAQDPARTAEVRIGPIRIERATR